ncbi:MULTISPECIES: glycosyltransferase family 2 protein [Burkholderia]|uniref:glycosyltransferase family 2 protein n=1 Tax=Burkholderia TaxID=32008 RepID=UPI0009E2DB43|nr:MULTISPECIES: glycosyltransferase family 2 protein [Burkholderia]
MLRNFLRFRWGLDCLSIARAGEVDHAASISADQVVEIELKSKVPVGWYMLELEVLVEGGDAVGKLNLDAGGYKNTKEWNIEIPLKSEEIGKRIIYVGATLSDLHIYFDIESKVRNINYFRLVRLSEKFAKSRIVKKLIALHPDYREMDAAKIPLERMWRDYCLLFRDLSGGIPYAIWIKEYEANIIDVISKSERSDSISVSRRRGIFIDRTLVGGVGVAISQDVLAGFRENFENILIASQRALGETIPLFELNDVDDRGCWSESDIRSMETRSKFSIESLDDDDWLFFLSNGYIVSAAAAHALRSAIVAAHSADIIFGDEDSVDFDGNRHSPYFKGCWNRELFFSKNILSGMAAFRVGALRKGGCPISGVRNLTAFEVALEILGTVSPKDIVHVPVVLAHQRRQARIQAVCDNESLIQECSQLEAYFAKLNQAVNISVLPHGRRVEYESVVPEPLVSLIIPTRNRCDLLRQCVDSILKKTVYENFEIIVIDNGSDEAESLRYLSEINENDRISVICVNEPFNYSLLNNRAVTLARGEIVGLLNNDIEVLSPHWLGEMVSCAMQDGVGAVGAKLLYPDERIQHAGVVMGIHGGADHVHRFESRTSTGYFGNASYSQCYMAVTAACLIVKKSLFNEVGGLDEENFVVAFNDVDFCLKLHDAGYRNVWTPHAELIHHESASRGRDDNVEKMQRAQRELECMRARWGRYIQDDPVYNPNLSLNGKLYTLASPSRVGVANIARRGF